MGGQAFAAVISQGAMPRMPPAVYYSIRNESLAKLRTLYHIVATPIEGPGKGSHGDIDVLVAEPKNVEPKRGSGSGVEKVGVEEGKKANGKGSNSHKTKPLDTIAELLGAVHVIKTSGKDGLSANLAIRWPEGMLPPREGGDGGSGRGVYWDGVDEEVLGAVREAVRGAREGFPEKNDYDDGEMAQSKGVNGNDNSSSNGNKNEGSPLFIQIDIRICDTAHNLRWRAFKHAHGDIWNLFGTVIRSFGLTADEMGLYVRVEEIEETDKKRAKILVTEDPGTVLEVLGVGNVVAGMNTTGSQGNGNGPAFINDTEGDDRVEKIGTTEGEEGALQTLLTGHLQNKPVWTTTPFDSIDQMFRYVASSSLFWVFPPEMEREGLKSNDRRRMKMRPVFRRWMEEFLPGIKEELRVFREAEAARGEEDDNDRDGDDITNDDISGGNVNGNDHSSDVNGPRSGSSKPFPYPTTPPLTRNLLLKSLFKSFPHLPPIYSARLAAFRRENAIQTIKRGLKSEGWIPEREWQGTDGQWRGQSAGAFRKILFEGSEEFGETVEMAEERGYRVRDWVGGERGTVALEGDGDKEGMEEEQWTWNAEEVKRWVGDVWEDVGRRAQVVYGAAHRAKMEQKEKEREKERKRKADGSPECEDQVGVVKVLG